MSDKLKITLKVAALQDPLALMVDYGADEKYWREAAGLFNERWRSFKEKYPDEKIVGSDRLMVMAALGIARKYCELQQEYKTLLADLKRLDAETAKIIAGDKREE